MFQVKKRMLLAIAGTVWLIAGFNVAKIGLTTYAENQLVTIWGICTSILIFCLFGMMFYKMSIKHTIRITSYKEEKKPFWVFFDAKSYFIMIFMMSGGIWLRYSGLVPQVFIAVFYTGLGLALALAGITFWTKYFHFSEI
ncbi:MAG: hypothetical protein RSC19_08955 [Lachnospiraceae bacterium]